MMLARCNSQAVDGRGLHSRAAHSSLPLSAVTFVRRMRGGAQSSLLRASDGELYVVKLHGNPQGHNVLANEALGSWLAAQLGLETPAWRPISVSDELLAQNPEMWFETPTGRVRPPAGVHYASRLVETQGEGSVFEILPRSWFARVQNREDFLGMLLLDLWCNHTDNRQACFVQEAGARGLRAVFLDQGHMFNGADGTTNARPAASLFLDRTMYEGLWSQKQVNEWMRKICAIPAQAAYTFVASLPAAWSAAPMELTVASLLERRPMFQQLLRGVRALVEGPSPLRKPVQRAHDSSEPLRFSGHSLRACPGPGDQLCVGAAR